MRAANLGSVKQLANVLRATTVRDFDGGWNTSDSDLNLEPKYARVLDNLERGSDGTLSVRPGTLFFAGIAADLSDIVDMCYFNEFTVVVQYSGRVSLVNANGVVTYLPLGYTGTNAWPSGVTFVSFTQLNNTLILSNGVNKPLCISGNLTDPLYMTLQYLVDAATLSNINTPIAKYVVAHAQFTVFAGLPDKPSTLSISARNTSGTFLGDPAPNDAIELDLGPRVSHGSSTITGLLSYQDKLLVAFENGVLPVNLGVYTGDPAVHTPTDDGFIEEYGCIAHRSMINLGEDAYYCDNVGVDFVSRGSFTNALKPVRASELVDTEITNAVSALTARQLCENVFAVYDIKHMRYMLFVPTYVSGVLTETVCFSFTDRKASKTKAWARLRGWKWSAACRTARQNILFAVANKLYMYDFSAIDTALDFLDDPTVNNGDGVPITFDWELPWADFGQRMKNKHCQYVAMDATGGGTFTLKMYVDNFRVDRDNVDSPALQLDFRGGMPHGYGADTYSTSPYGAGRLTADERWYEWPAEFHLAKFRICGDTSKPLSFASISILYRLGALGR